MSKELFSTGELFELPSKKIKESKAIKVKTKSDYRLGKRYQRAKEVIGQISHDETIHYVSAGEWSAHDLLFHLLEQTGPAVVHIATWSITENPARQLVKRLNSGQIVKLNIIFDWRVKVRCPAAFELTKFNSADVRLTTCHAKVTIIENEEWQVAIVGSANYTNNPRIEAGVIACDKRIADFHKNWILQELKNSNPFDLK